LDRWRQRLLAGRAVGLLGHVEPITSEAPAPSGLRITDQGPGPREAHSDSPTPESNAGHVGTFRAPGLRLITTTILITLTAFPAVLITLAAFATIFKALTTFLTAHETLAVTVAVAALIETGAVPAV